MPDMKPLESNPNDFQYAHYCALEISHLPDGYEKACEFRTEGTASILAKGGPWEVLLERYFHHSVFELKYPATECVVSEEILHCVVSNGSIDGGIPWIMAGVCFNIFFNYINFFILRAYYEVNEDGSFVGDLDGLPELTEFVTAEDFESMFSELRRFDGASVRLGFIEKKDLPLFFAGKQ